MNIIIRNLNQTTVDHIKAAAEAHGQSQQELLLALLEREFGQARKVIASQEVEAAATACSACGIGSGTRLVFFSDNTFKNLCPLCARKV